MENKYRISYHVPAFLLLAIIILLKICIFHQQCFGFLYGWHTYLETPHVVIAFYLPKIAVALCLASFVFLFRRQWWSVILLLIIDTWCVANLTYFRANNLFLSLDSIRMASNLHGFTASIGQYTDVVSWLFFITTAVYAGILFLCRNMSSRRSWIAFVVSFAVGVACSLYGGYKMFDVYHYEQDIPFDAQYLNPFVVPDDIASEEWQQERQQLNYVFNRSIITYSVNMLYEGYKIDKMRDEKEPLTEHEADLLKKALNNNAIDSICPQRNIIFVMVESFESWTLEIKDREGNAATPNILNLMQHRPTLYCHNMKSQVLHGVSGDGQMICNTGLLPVQSGAACMLYGHNTYPNFAHFYPQSALFNPTVNAWNQNTMTRSYGYKTQHQPEDTREADRIIATSNWWDEVIYPRVIEQIEQYDKNQPFCTFVLTLSSHSPFNLYDHNFMMDLKEDWSVNARAYIGSIHYMDHYLGQLIDYMENNGLFDNTLLVITGDHTIYKDATVSQYLIEGAQQAGLSVANGHNYVPLIITGAGITENKTIEETVYQMDIYPTIMHLIGADDCYWSGFGCDLSADTLSRRFTEQEAYLLSDKIIRNNEFKYKDKSTKIKDKR